MHFHLLVWIDWFHHWKFNLALSFFSFVYLTASVQVFIQMKASRILICRLNFKSFHVCCQTWLCVLLYSEKITDYMLKIKQFWRPFADDKSLGHRMKCVCVCLITEWHHLKCCMQFVCWIVIKVFFSFSFSFSFPPFFPVDFHRRFGCFERRDFPGWSWGSKWARLLLWHNWPLDVKTAGSNWRKKHPETSKITYTKRGVQISHWMLISKSKKVRTF